MQAPNSKKIVVSGSGQMMGDFDLGLKGIKYKVLSIKTSA
jgi:hypothetical protein